MLRPHTNNILGVNISITNMEELVKTVLSQLEDLKGQYLCFSNVHTTVMSYENPEYRKVQNSSFMSLPDGSPLSYVQRIRGHKEAKRCAGPDFMDALWRATENTEITHYFYGSTESTIESLRKCLEKKYPGLKIAGMESPPFRTLTAEEDEEAIRKINESGASILWVGLGAPKQEEWMYAHKGKINALMCGVGAGFDFHAGIARRAPMWMQTHYLEWLYRLFQDPSRLWRRYMKTNIKFVVTLLKQMGRNENLLTTDGVRKNLLIYAHYYYPDVASTGQILTDLAEGLKEDFNITVICTVPSYTGKIARKYRTHKYYFENINGITVLRIRVPEFRKSFKVSRIYNIAQYFLGAIAATYKTGPQDYVYSISQPPVLGGILGVIGKRIKKAKYIYNIQDFNPEQVQAISYSKNKLILNTMMKLDCFSCKQADKVIVVGRDMVKTLEHRFRGKKGLTKYTCINNWIDEEEIKPLPATNEIVKKLRREYELENKYVIMYSGNIGLYYDLLNLIRVMEKFKEYKDIIFLFAGDGSVLETLKKYVSDHAMENVRFAPYQKKSDLIYSLNLADVHLVVNARGIKGVSVPSKLYGCMAAGKPVLGILEDGSEARMIIEESGCGKCVDPGDYKSIARLMKEFADTRESASQTAMGEKGRLFLEKKLKKEISIHKYRDEILNS